MDSGALIIAKVASQFPNGDFEDGLPTKFQARTLREFPLWLRLPERPTSLVEHGIVFGSELNYL